MKLGIKFVAIVLYLLPFGAMAGGENSTGPIPGQERGNGGGVMVVRDEKDKIVSVELLDFFEARNLRGW